MREETKREATAGIDVRYVAGLARLNLTDAEVAEFQGQLDQILAFFNALRSVDVEGVEPTAHAIAVQNVLRDDEARPGLPRETVMANAPASQDGQFVVPKIIE